MASLPVLCPSHNKSAIVTTTWPDKNCNIVHVLNDNVHCNYQSAVLTNVDRLYLCVCVTGRELVSRDVSVFLLNESNIFLLCNFAFDVLSQSSI